MIPSHGYLFALKTLEFLKRALGRNKWRGKKGMESRQPHVLWGSPTSYHHWLDVLVGGGDMEAITRRTWLHAPPAGPVTSLSCGQSCGPYCRPTYWVQLGEGSLWWKAWPISDPWRLLAFTEDFLLICSLGSSSAEKEVPSWAAFRGSEDRNWTLCKGHQ